MKKILNILLCFICSIIIILSLAVIFIEGRLLISLDWSIYDNPINGFIRYLFRLIIACFSLTVALLEIINIFKKFNFSIVLLFLDISLMLSCIIILLFSTNYVGLVCLTLSTLLLLFKTLLTILNKKC